MPNTILRVELLLYYCYLISDEPFSRFLEPSMVSSEPFAILGSFAYCPLGLFSIIYYNLQVQRIELLKFINMMEMINLGRIEK